MMNGALCTTQSPLMFLYTSNTLNLAGAPEEGPCVLTWDEGAEPTLTDMEPHPISSHAYTWLQSTGTCLHLAAFNSAYASL